MKKKLKIGIFLNDHRELNDGQIKTVNDILNSKLTNLSYVFQYKQAFKLNFAVSLFYKFISKLEKKYCRISRISKDKKVKKINLIKSDIDI